MGIDAGLGYPEPALLVDGEWLAGDGRDGLDVIDPATGRSLGQVPLASTADLDRALDAARRAFRTWRATAPQERAGVLTRAADLLRQRRDAIARTMTLEEGKTLAESCGEVDFTADIVEFLAGEAFRTFGKVVPSAGSRRTLVLREPVGPVAAFTPWNYPLTVPARKVAAALAGGSTVVW